MYSQFNKTKYYLINFELFIPAQSSPSISNLYSEDTCEKDSNTVNNLASTNPIVINIVYFSSNFSVKAAWLILNTCRDVDLYIPEC